jgi:cell division protein FtsN
MAARRGKTQAKRNGSGGSKPAWVWMLIGVALGVLALAAWQLRDRWNPKDGFLPTPDPDAHAPAQTSEDPIAPAPVERPKPKYDFYVLLEEAEVVIPDADLAEQAEAEARRAAAAEAAAAAAAASPAGTSPTPPITPIDPVTAPPAVGSYVLQAGAFRSESDAEALKARIALTGEVARVEPADIKGNRVFRVRMGPYASAGTLSAAKQALVAHGIDGAQAIRVK